MYKPLKILTVTGGNFDKLKRWVTKAWNKGSFTATGVDAGPYGSDTVPVNKTVGIYARTEKDGNEYFLGYLNTNRLAAPGENRQFATDADGTLKFYIWQRNDGTCSIGGEDNNAVKYNESKTELDALKKTVNDLVTAFNGHSHLDPVSGALPPPTAVTNVIPATPNASDFTNIKNDKIKTI